MKIKRHKPKGHHNDNNHANRNSNINDTNSSSSSNRNNTSRRTRAGRQQAQHEAIASQRQEAIRRNNMAVAQLQGGDFAFAAMAFSEVLQEFHQLDVHNGMDVAQNTTAENVDSCMTRTPVRDTDQIIWSDRYLYRHPIKIPTDMRDITSCAALVLFNLALAYQLDILSDEDQESVINITRTATSNTTTSSSSSSSSSSRGRTTLHQCNADDNSNPSSSLLLTRTVSRRNSNEEMTVDESQQSLLVAIAGIYEKCFRLVIGRQIDKSSLLTMAVLNNLGVVYDCLNDSATSHICFHRLLSCLMYLVEGDSLETCDMVDGFFWNISFYLYGCHLAPAA